MKLSKLADYGTMLMATMAKETLWFTATQLAVKTHLPLPTVRKILKQLTKKHLVQSKQGMAGGYTLNKPAAEISMIDIITAMDDPLTLTECATLHGCALEHYCQAKGNWQLISQTLQKVFSNISLTELAHNNIAFEIKVQRTPLHAKAEEHYS